jgi:putative membrane protein
VTIGAISPSKKAVVDRLTAIDRAGFDKAFMTQMVEDHRKSVDLYTRGTASPDTDIKAFASRTLPTIKKHLAEAEDILKGLGPTAR